MTKQEQVETPHIGTCALCDVENVVLRRSHIIPRFAYQWIKDSSPTPYLRSSDNVNKREQDGPKEFLLCNECEGYLAVMETELAEKLFNKIANYRNQAKEIVITNAMQLAVLSIFWRTLLTSINRSNIYSEEDKEVLRHFLTSAKKQVRQGVVTTPIYVVPFYGEPPFYGLPASMTYMLDRNVGGQDMRFFDGPHRYYAIFKLPFVFFYTVSEGWTEEIDSNTKLSGTLRLDKIRHIPAFIRDYILWMSEQFEISKQKMSCENQEQIMRDMSKSKNTTGSHKSIKRSRPESPQFSD